MGLVLAALLLGGCSSIRLGYNHAPDLIYWRLDSYADFSGPQKARVKAGIADWMQWHRATQLPDYMEVLHRVQPQMLADTTPAAVCGLMDTVSARIERGLTQALPAFADVALTLSPEQLVNIEQRYAKGNEEFRKDHLQDTMAERRKAAVKRTTENAERLYGPLQQTQLDVIEKEVAVSPLDADLWWAERQERQRDTLATLRRLIESRSNQAQAMSAIKVLGERLRRSPDARYAAYQQKLRQHNCQFAAVLHNLTTPEQRQHAGNRVDRWARDVQLLVDER